MVPPCSDRISRVPPYSRTTLLSTHTGLSPSMAVLPSTFWFLQSGHWPSPRSLATTNGVSIDVLSSGYLDVSVPRVRFSYPMYSGKDTVSDCGFPHSDICGSRVVRTSPQLFAAYHVLRRLLKPRHPPNALMRLFCLRTSLLLL